MTCSATYS